MRKKKTLSSITVETAMQMDDEAIDGLMGLAASIIADKKKVKKYEPNSVQDRVHKSTAFIRALFSGNGVGKTTACIHEAIWTSTGTHPHRETARLPNTVIIVLDDSSKADSVYMAELRKRNWYDMSKLKTFKDGRAHTQRVVFPNGSEWVFMTHEMAEDKWESIQCACVIFDEPPPRFIYVALLRGMREKDMKPWIMFAGTPRGRNAPWMYKEIYKPWREGKDDEIECFFGSTHENLHNLDPETIARWEKRYTKAELATRLYGSFEFLSGRIFDGFNRKDHVVPDFPWPRHWPCIIAVDPHLRKDHCAVLLGVDPDGDIWAIKELKTPLAGRRAASFFIRSVEGYNVRAGICDNFGSINMYDDVGSEEKKSFIRIWNEVAMGLRRARCCIRPTTTKEKKDQEWIEDMRDLLRLEPTHEGEEPQARFHVFESCVMLIDNFETYVWDEHTGRKADLQDEPKEEPLGTNQDFLMCVKYGLAMKPETLLNQVGPISRRMMSGKEAMYESHGLPSNWYKD